MFLGKVKCVEFGFCLALLAGAIVGAGAGDLDPSAPPAPTMTTLSDIGTAASGAQTAASSADSAAQGAASAATAAQTAASSADTAAQAAAAAAGSAQTAAQGAETAALAAQDPRTAITSFPHTISQPGSYYLTGNLSASSGSGITIEASGVAVDLMGFALTGSGDSSTDDAIASGTGSWENVTVRNGTIADWGGSGVDLRQHRNCLVENLIIQDCGNDGIYAYGGVVRGCTVSGCVTGIVAHVKTVVVECVTRLNTGTGIFTGDSMVISCTSTSNSEDGIEGVAGALIADCISIGNTDDGILTAAGSTVRGCVARQNGDDGIEVGETCLVIGNNCTWNNQQAVGGAGIYATGHSNRIEGNTATFNFYGIFLGGEQNLVVRNMARENTSNNYAIGTNNHVAQRLSGGINFVSTDPWANFEF